MGTEVFLRVGIDGTGSVTGARVVKRSMDEVRQAASLTDKQVDLVNQSISKIGQNAQGVRTIKRDLDDVASSTTRFSHMLDSIEDRLIRVGVSTAVFMLLGRAIAGVRDITKETLQYLGQIETSTLGIASSFLVSGNFVDTATNKVLTGQRAMDAALGMSRDVIEQLKVANMQTIATLDQLIVAYQVTLPVAMAKGFKKDQVMDFTLAMVQAAGAIGLPFDQMAEETRSLLTGAINPRTSRIATVLGIRNEDIREYQGNADALFKFLMSRLEGFRIAGLESQKTWAGLWSNLKDIANQGAGIAFEGMFKAVKDELMALQNSIVTINTETKKITWNPEFVAKAKDLGKDISSIFSAFVTGTKFVFEHINAIKNVLILYAEYKAITLTVWAAQALLGTELAKNIILAERVASGYANYVNSPGSTALRAGEAKAIAVAQAVSTQAEVDNLMAVRANTLEKQKAIASGVAYLATLEQEALANTAATAAELERSAARKTQLAQQLTWIDKEIATLDTKGNLTKKEIAYQKELRNASLSTRGAINTANLEGDMIQQRHNANLAISQKATDNVTNARGRLAIVNTELSATERLATTASEANTAAHGAAVAAQEAHNASLAKLTIGQRLYTAGTALATAATNVFSQAINLIGGPIGVAIGLVTSLYWALYKLYHLQETKQDSLATIANEGDFNKLVRRQNEAKAQIAEIEKQRKQEEMDKKSATPQEREESAVVGALIQYEKDRNGYIKERQALINSIVEMENNPTNKSAWRDSETGLTKLETAQARLRNIQTIMSEQGRQQVIETAKAEAKLASMTKYVPNPPKPPDVSGELSASDKAFNALLSHWDEWDQRVIRSSKHQDELAAAIASVNADLKSQITAQDLNYKDPGVQMMIERYKEKAQLIRENLALNANEKAQDQYDKAQERASLQEYRSNLTERRAALQVSLEDRKINQQQYYQLTGNMIEEESAKEILALQRVVDEKKKKVSETPTVRADLYLTASAELKKAESDLDKQRSDAARRYEENLRNQIKLLREQQKEINELNRKNTVDEAQALSDAEKNKVNSDKIGNPFKGIDLQLAAEKAAIKAKYDAEREELQLKLDSIKGATERQLEMIDTVHEKQMSAIDAENKLRIAGITDKTLRDNETKRYEDERLKLISEYSKKGADIKMKASTQTQKFEEAIKKAMTLTDIKQKNEEVDAENKATNSKMQAYSNYAQFGAEALTLLAETQDQTSRSGFENAKMFNLGAAVMSTAAAIINQLSTGDPYTGWIRAAMAAALGAVQIAKIMSTTYGGGGSVSSVSAGSFGSGGGSSANGVGAKIGTPYMKDNSPSEERLSEISISMENASLALSRVADGLVDISDLFKEGSFLSMLGGSFVTDVGSSLMNHIYSKTISINLKGSDVSASIDTLFDKPDSQRFEDEIQTTVNSIFSQVKLGAAVMGTSINPSLLSKVNVPFSMNTKDKSAADINKQFQTWLETVSDTLAKTVVGLEKFAFLGEKAFDALIRLSTALQTTNEGLELIGVNLFDASLEGADIAWNFQEFMGGADKFKDTVQTYFESMFTESQQDLMKYKQSDRQVKTAFGSLNIAIPETKEGFIALVNSLDLTNVTGARTFETLMGVAEAFGYTKDYIKDTTKELNEYNNDIKSRTLRLNGGSSELFDKAIADEDELATAKEKGYNITQLLIVQAGEWADGISKAFEDMANNTLETIKSTSDAINEIIDVQLGALDAMRSIRTTQSNLSPEELYNQKREAFLNAETKDKARTGTEFLEASKTYNASGGMYTSDVNMVMNALGNIANIDPNASLSAIDKQINSLNDIKTAVSKGDVSIIDKLEDMLGDNSPLAKAFENWATVVTTTNQAQRESAASSTLTKIGTIRGQIFEDLKLNTPESLAELPGLYSSLDSLVAIFNGLVAGYQNPSDTAPQAPSWLPAPGKRYTRDEALILSGETNGIFTVTGTGPISGSTGGSSFTATGTGPISTGAMSDPAVSTAITSISGIISNLIRNIAIPRASYAIGTSSVPYDMMANIHQGEIIMDRQSSDILRRYGIPTSGSADNRGVEERLDKLIASNAEVERRLRNIENKARLVANA